jgi:hypothetical protein
VNAPLHDAVRMRLGIPADARQVLVLCESSHWDTNWLKTSAEYFDERVEPILFKALAALEAEPRRVYCIESLFFLERFWEKHAAEHARVRRLFEEGRLKLLSTSFTTPDTLLPHAETVLRDFELGHAWLEEVGLPAAPPTAYFPDNFGHSPHLPSLMQALGVRGVSVTRIDGMYFVGSDWEPRSNFPRAASTAELLEKVHKSHDFLWRDDSGAEVVCHWNAHTYFMGDMLAHKGVIRWAGNTYAVPWRTKRHIARRLDGYAEQLAGFARTPYLLCPIGMDFNDPIDGLQALVDRDNGRFGETGRWTVVAGLDDYFALLEPHREKLPVLEADPNPYWMGFLATRPEVKQRPTRIARTLLEAEALAAFAPRAPAVEEALALGWRTLVLSNHHDYIPGTSPDRVWNQEQKPWLDEAQNAAARALSLVNRKTVHPEPVEGRLNSPIHVSAPPRRDSILITTPHLRLELSRGHGGCLTSIRTAEGEQLAGLGFDLVAFHDEGGLWRLGHEYKGGRFERVARASDHPAEVEVEELPGEVCVRIVSRLQGERFVRTVRLNADQPLIRFRVEGVAPPRRTVTCRFETGRVPATLEMDTVGGVIVRPRARQFSPTFWPVPSRLTVRERTPLHALFESPTAASLDAQGGLEWIIARNAEKERAWRWLPVLAHPIGGTNDDLQAHEAALSFGDAPARAPWAMPALGQVRCDTAGVEVRAVKRAQRGEGFTVRLFAERVPSAPVRLSLQHAAIGEAWLCDALGRKLEPLALAAGEALVPMRARFASVRLR